MLEQNRIHVDTCYSLLELSLFEIKKCTFTFSFHPICTMYSHMNILPLNILCIFTLNCNQIAPSTVLS